MSKSQSAIRPISEYVS